MRVSINSGPVTKLLRRARDVVRKPFAAARGARQVRNIRRLETEELTRGGRFGIGGGFIPHAPTQSFGTRPATVPPLGGPGRSVGRAYLSAAFVVTSNSIRQVVRHPGAIAHRDGARIKITPKMRGFVRHRFGVNFGPRKTHVVIPARPIANWRAARYADAITSQFELELQEATR